MKTSSTTEGKCNMKAVILAGGLGTRLSELTEVKPKPMVEIGSKPIIWHIMKIYSHYGVNDFIICCGYKGYMIKEYFANYLLHMSDVTIDIQKNSVEVHQNNGEPWRITLVDTGETTMTGGRLKKIRKYVEGEKEFCFTYGDGLSDVNITKLIEFHRNHGKLVTLTAIQPPGRFGALNISDTEIHLFEEKPKGDGSWVNGGYFVVSPKIIDLIHNDETVWEQEPLKMVARQGELQAFKHEGFWHPMDTLRDKNILENLWQTGAPWRVWK